MGAVTMNEEKRKSDFNVSNVVFILLALLTVGEFFMGLLAYNWWAPLLAVAVLKAFLVVRDYMHIGKVFAGEEVEEH
jgi:cytochrome c oxidase subunit IV